MYVLCCQVYKLQFVQFPRPQSYKYIYSVLSIKRSPMVLKIFSAYEECLFMREKKKQPTNYMYIYIYLNTFIKKKNTYTTRQKFHLHFNESVQLDLK